LAGNKEPPLFNLTAAAANNLPPTRARSTVSPMSADLRVRQSEAPEIILPLGQREYPPASGGGENNTGEFRRQLKKFDAVFQQQGRERIIFTQMTSPMAEQCCRINAWSALRTRSCRSVLARINGVPSAWDGLTGRPPDPPSGCRAAFRHCPPASRCSRLGSSSHRAAASAHRG